MDLAGELDVVDRVMACIALFAHQVDQAASVMSQAMQMARERFAQEDVA